MPASKMAAAVVVIHSGTEISRLALTAPSISAKRNHLYEALALPNFTGIDE